MGLPVAIRSFDDTRQEHIPPVDRKPLEMLGFCSIILQKYGKSRLSGMGITVRHKVFSGK